MNETKEHPNNEQQLISTRQMFTMQKARYANKNQILFWMHIFIFFTWLFLRYGLPLLIWHMVKPTIKYFKDLVAEQNGSIQYKKVRK